MFTSSPSHFERNLAHSATVTASPARLTTPEGDHLPSVAVFTKGMVDIVITAEAARRLAAEIIDALVALKKEKPVRRDTDTNTAFEQLADR